MSAFEGCLKLPPRPPTTVLEDADFPAEWGDTIPDLAFVNRHDVLAVELPPRIKQIRTGSFAGCANLEGCPVPPGVYFPVSAFAGCTKLPPRPVTTVLRSEDFPAEWGGTVPINAFQDRLDVVKVVLPSRIKKIGTRAFSRCSNLKKCTVRSDVVIDEDAFVHCSKGGGPNWS